MHAPYPPELLLRQPTLPKDLERGLAVDKACVARIPSAEDLIVLLFLRLAERPGHLGRGCSSLLLVVLLEGLLQVRAVDRLGR